MSLIVRHQNQTNGGLTLFKRKSSEIRWLRACLKGNEKAFEHIVQHYQPLVCAITYSRTGNRADSEELAQEVFIKAWRNLHQLEDLAKFHSWLCRIAQTTVQNWYRSRKRDVVAGAAPLENVEATAGIESNPEEKTIRQEHEALVSQALSQLPIELREALVLYYRGEHSTRQVALQLDISEGATRTRISRGRQILRGRLHSIVEETLTLTRPGQTFTRVVMASLTALSIDNATAVASSHLSAHGLSIGGLSLSAAGKLSLIVAGLTIAVGSLAVYRQRENTAIEHLSPQPQIAASKTNDVSEVGLDLRSIERQATTAPGIGQPASSEFESPSLSPNTESPSAPLEPYVFKPKGVLSGLVTDIETGEAVVNAWVRLSTYPSIETQTDIHGFYSFSYDDANGIESCKIAVEATTHVDPERRGSNYSSIQLTQDIQVVKHFDLARGCCLDVQVVDSNGIGIPNARVLASAPYDLLNQLTGFWGTSKRGTLVQTDPNGMVTLGPYPVADTDYLIQAWDESKLRVDKESMAPEELRSLRRYAPAHTLVQLNNPSIIPQVKITLERGESVYGFAEYSDGVPATGIEIGAYPTWWQTNNSHLPRYTVHMDGSFVLDHITPGRYQIWAHFPGQGVLGGTIGGRMILEAQLPQNDSAPLMLRLLDASPLGQPSIGGILFINNVTHPVEIGIELSDSTSTRTTVTTLAPVLGTIEQSFRFSRLEFGSYRLTFSGQFLETRILERVEAPSTNLEIELYPIIADPNLTGFVADLKTGRPIEQFKIRVCKLKTLRGPNYGEEPRVYEFNNPFGQFSIRARLGIYQLEVVADGYAPQWSPEINMDLDNTISMVLSPGGHITGMVLDASGRPISGAQVIPLCRARGAKPEERLLFVNKKGAATTIDGQFTLQHLAAGMETLKIIHPDYAASVVEQVEVLNDQTTSDLVITLQSGGTLEGHVYDGEGNPQPKQRLLFLGGCESMQLHRLQYRHTHQLGTAVTDSKGYYKVAHLPEQLCTVYRANHETALGVVRCAVTPLNGTTQHLDLGDAGINRVSGNVVFDGAPLINARLLLASIDSPSYGNPMCFAKTDNWGSFVFRGIPPGGYALYYKNPNTFRQFKRIATGEVESYELDVGVIYYDSDRDN